jgi:hypothetical protein
MVENGPIKPMNLRTAKLAFALCSLCLINLTASIRAQDTNSGDTSQPPDNGGESQRQGDGRRGGGGPADGRRVAAPDPVFDIQIENGELSLAPLAGHSETTNFWAPGTKTVPATMENISRYLRATDPRLSVVLSPGTGESVISDLKLKTTAFRSISEAIRVASGNTISGNDRLGAGEGFGGFGGAGGYIGRAVTFTSSSPRSKSFVEVFNLSGYIQTLGKVDDHDIMGKIEQLKDLILTTLQDLSKSSADRPDFKFHSGTKLFIVIGKPEAIEVTRKIINALSRQQPNAKTELINPTLDTPPPADQK